MKSKIKFFVYVSLTLTAFITFALLPNASATPLALWEEGVNDAQFVSQTVPLSMVAGQTYEVSVTMKNIGTSTWSKGAGYKLGSQNPQDNLTWGLNRVNIASSQAISPGKSTTFKFLVTAPSQTGLFNFQWQMLREGKGGTSTVFFGQLSTNVEVNVIGAGGGSDDAQFIAQTVPTPLKVNLSATASITLKNIGTTTWASDKGYRLGTQNPPLNSLWGLSTVALPKAVTPGETVTFTFTFTAPAIPGTYNFQWQMMKEGTGFFGAITPNFLINVTDIGGANDARFISQTAPTTVVIGQTFGITIRMRNMGTTTWTLQNGYKLASQNPPDNLIWGVSRVNLPVTVGEGEETTFVFNIRAPLTVGTYNLQWQMIQEGVGYFGEMSSNLAINVTSTPPADEEGFGNNLSVPNIFAEGYGITGLPTIQDTGMRPRPEEGTVTLPYFDMNHIYINNGTIFYPQQNPSVWRATIADGDLLNGEHVVVNWSDNLLNTRWTPRQVIRVETVLYKNLLPAMTAYTMGHLYGQGTTEMWGADVTTYESLYKTVFSVNARLKIEKLDGPGGNPIPKAPCGFNGAVYEKFGLDGSGGYGAEVNVSGSTVYGFNWQLNQCTATQTQKLGWWRLTFTLDPIASYTLGGINYSVPRNAFLDALDPGDLAGTFFRPQLISNSTTILEIEITAKGGGK
ncbi:MAG: NBR1-Ig-like domain-containing protein [Acidobacteriota bacterium]